jgi:outer membrane protein assembly factor BamB
MDAGVTRRELLGSVGTATALAATGQTQAARAQADGAWPTFAYDEANTGYAPEASGPTDDVGGEWRVDLGQGVNSSAAVVDGTVYVGSDDTNLYALSPSDGSTQWSFETGDRVTSSPSVVDGTVYVGSNDGLVYAVDAADGTEVWSFETGAQVTASPTVVDGIVYIGSRDDGVYAVDAADGTEVWSVETDNDVSATPAVVDGTVYVGSEDWGLYALDADDGTEQWSFGTSREITAAPAVSDDGETVYVGSLDGNLYALGTEGGEPQWGFPTGGPIVASPAVDPEAVYVGSRDGTLYALNPGDGEERWSFDTGRQIISSPSVAGSVVYVGSQSRAVFGILATGGNSIWRFDTEGLVTASPAVVDGTVYIGADDGAFYALREGARLPTTETPTPAASDDGSTGLRPLALPATLVAFATVVVGTGYAAYRAGLFDPIEEAGPEAPPEDGENGQEDTAGSESEADDGGAGEAPGASAGEAGPADGEDLFPIWDVVIDDVIGRAEESTRTATQDLLVTKHVDSDTLAQPMVAYEIESLWSEPVTVRLSEPLGESGISDDAIGRLGTGWRVEGDRLVYEASLEPDGQSRTIVARGDLSPTDTEALLAQPSVTARQ